MGWLDAMQGATCCLPLLGVHGRVLGVVGVVDDVHTIQQLVVLAMLRVHLVDVVEALLEDQLELVLRRYPAGSVVRWRGLPLQGGEVDQVLGAVVDGVLQAEPVLVAEDGEGVLVLEFDAVDGVAELQPRRRLQLLPSSHQIMQNTCAYTIQFEFGTVA